MKKKIVDDSVFASEVADFIIDEINRVLATQERCSLSLCGGGTPGAVYSLLGKEPRISKVCWEAVDLYWGDDRFVPYDDDRSNVRLVKETLLKAPEMKARYYPFNTEASSAQESASLYNTLLSGQGYGIRDSLKKIDISLLGLGTDGHTASLFPEQAHPDNAMTLACVHPTDGTERMSLAPSFLFDSHTVIFLVSGSGKSKVAQAVLEDADISPTEMPAKYMWQASGEVHCLLDRSAASMLSCSDSKD